MLTINIDRLNIQANHRILDLGCGEGRHTISSHLLTPAECIIGVDLSSKDINTAKHRLQELSGKSSTKSCELLVADGLSLPFNDNYFDIVICSEVLEHIPDYQKMLSEVRRVTKLGGTFAVSVPRAWPEQICWWLSKKYHQVKGGHIRIFNAKHLRDDIEQLDFEFKHKHWAHALHSPYWWLRCLFWRETEQIFLARWYHKILVWDLMKKPWLTQFLERQLNPLMGKSVVMYFTKQKRQKS